MIAYNVSDSISPPNNLTIVANNVFQVLGYISAISGVIDIVVLATKLINAFCNWIKKFLNK